MKKILIIFFSILFGITFSYLIPIKQAQVVIQTSSGAYLFIVNTHGLMTIQEGGCDPSTLKKGYIDFENIDSQRTFLLLSLIHI